MQVHVGDHQPLGRMVRHGIGKHELHVVHEHVLAVRLHAYLDLFRHFINFLPSFRAFPCQFVMGAHLGHRNVLHAVDGFRVPSEGRGQRQQKHAQNAEHGCK